MVDRQTLSFALETVKAGRYELSVFSGRAKSRSLAVDVPEGGLSGQRLVFELER